MVKKFWNLIFIGCALASCNEQESTKDIAYYSKHPKERRQKIAQCKNNLAELENTSNCKNALEAEKQCTFDFSRKDSKDIRLPDVKADKYNLPAIKDDLPHFLEDDESRRKAIDQCERNPIALKGSEYCKNALEAEKLKQNSSKNNP